MTGHNLTPRDGLKPEEFAGVQLGFLGSALGTKWITSELARDELMQARWQVEHYKKLNNGHAITPDVQNNVGSMDILVKAAKALVAKRPLELVELPYATTPLFESAKKVLEPVCQPTLDNVSKIVFRATFDGCQLAQTFASHQPVGYKSMRDVVKTAIGAAVDIRRERDTVIEPQSDSSDIEAALRAPDFMSDGMAAIHFVPVGDIDENSPEGTVPTHETFVPFYQQYIDPTKNAAPFLGALIDDVIVLGNELDKLR